MGLVDHIRNFAIAASATVLVTCTSGETVLDQFVREQEVMSSLDDSTRPGQVAANLEEPTIRLEGSKPPRIQGEALEYAIQHSFYHAGQFSTNVNDLLAREQNFTRHDYEAQFFITTTHDEYVSEVNVGVIHLHDEAHEIDIMVYQSDGFPSETPSNAGTIVHYHEFGARYYRLQVVLHDGRIMVAGGPAELGQRDAQHFFEQMINLYNAAMGELHVQERIMADYRMHQEGLTQK